MNRNASYPPVKTLPALRGAGRVACPNALLSLLLLVGLLLGSCGSSEQMTASNDFVSGDSDYQLSCDTTGDGEDALACQLAYYTNRERAAHVDEADYADPLDWNDGLAAVAADYSQWMCDDGFFDHVDPAGQRVGQRLKNAGVAWAKAGENLAKGVDFYPGQVMSMFMDEPSCETNHRGNVLDNDYTDVGVGVVFCGDNILYTEIFAAFSEQDLRQDRNEYCD